MALRINIDGEWSASDFSALFAELHSYYEFSASRFRSFAYAPIEDDRFLIRLAALSTPLQVRRIQFGSPGFTDLAGIGALTRELREFVQFLIVHFRDSEDRKLSREERRIRIAQARLELLEKFRSVRAHQRDDDPFLISAAVSEFLDIPKFEEIGNAIMDGRITDLLETDEE